MPTLPHVISMVALCCLWFVCRQKYIEEQHLDSAEACCQLFGCQRQMGVAQRTLPGANCDRIAIPRGPIAEQHWASLLFLFWISRLLSSAGLPPSMPGNRSKWRSSDGQGPTGGTRPIEDSRRNLCACVCRHHDLNTMHCLSRSNHRPFVARVLPMARFNKLPLPRRFRHAITDDPQMNTPVLGAQATAMPHTRFCRAVA